MPAVAVASPHAATDCTMFNAAAVAVAMAVAVAVSFFLPSFLCGCGSFLLPSFVSGLCRVSEAGGDGDHPELNRQAAGAGAENVLSLIQ
eukprot:COSAG06_NODE_288_length_18224_cov_8.849948_2_plen_89_part_00